MMNLNKTVMLAFPVIISCTLTGCGEKTAKVSVPPLMSAMKNTGKLAYLSGEVYQISQADYDQYQQAKSDAAKAKKIILGINDKQQSTLAGIKNDQIKTKAESLLKTSQSQRQHAQQAWQHFYQQQKAALEGEIARLQSDIQETQKNYASYQSDIKPYQDKVKQIEQKIDGLKQQKNALFEQYMQAVNKDIIDYSLPIHKVSNIGFRYSYRKVGHRGCGHPKYPPMKIGGYCYSLKPVDQRLLDKPSYQVAQRLFAKELTIEHQLGPQYGAKSGTVHYALNQAQKTLKEQKIIARNQHSFKYEPDSWQFKQAQQQLKNDNKTLMELGTDKTKTGYILSQLRDVSRQTDKVFDQSLATIRKRLLSHATHDTGIKFGQDIELESDGKRGVIVYHVRDNLNITRTMIGSFDVAAQNKLDKPTIDTMGEHSFRGNMTMNNPKVNRYLFEANPSNGLFW